MADGTVAANEGVVRATYMHAMEGGSDKVYHVFLLKEGDGYTVSVEYGRRGGPLKPGQLTKAPTTLDAATDIFVRRVNEKRNGSSHYKVTQEYIANAEPGTPQAPSAAAPPKPMQSVERVESRHRPFLPAFGGYERREIEVYLLGPRWLAQEKHNGERVIVDASGKDVTGVQKQGYLRPLPNEIVAAFAGKHVVTDGELVGSRYVVFDLLEQDGQDLKGLPYSERLKRLESVVESIADAGGGESVELVRTVSGEAAKRALLDELDEQGLEGLVFKQADAAYIPGETVVAVKFKFYGESSVIVHAHSPDRRSVETAAYHNGEYRVLGNVTIPPSAEMPPVGSVIECRYLYAQRPSYALFQPQFQRVRTDQDHSACTTSKFRMWKNEFDAPIESAPSARPSRPKMR